MEIEKLPKINLIIFESLSAKIKNFIYDVFPLTY
nr:MAG TPA: hypothetical protein [Caudoviricetes sp.]